ncbi:MAG: O-antigen ligase family protein [Nitrospirae bacterium]|nr:O-antigen ligase family protein [Nitrospirota bacterium]
MVIFFLYAVLTAVAIARPYLIIYLLVIGAPFYEYFTEFFRKVCLVNICFTLKPFLFLTVLLISLSFFKLNLKNRLSFTSFELSHKTAILFLSFFAIIMFYFSLQSGSGYLTEINMLINISLSFFVPYFYYKREIKLNLLVRTLTVVVFFVSAYSLIYFFLKNPVFLRFSKHPGFCSFLLFTFPFLMVDYFLVQGKARTVFCLVTVFISFLAILFSLTRSSFIGLLIIIPLFIVFMVKVLSDNSVVLLKIRLLVFGLVFAVLVSAWFSPMIREAIIFPKAIFIVSDKNVIKDDAANKIENTYLKNAYLVLAHERTIVWRKSIDLIMSSPFKGYGFNYHVVPGLLGAHNNFVAILVAGGVIGLVLFIIALVAILLTLSKKIQPIFSVTKRLFFFAIFCSLICVFIQGLVQTVINEYIIWLVVAFVFLDPEFLVISGKDWEFSDCRRS